MNIRLFRHFPDKIFHPVNTETLIPQLNIAAECMACHGSDGISQNVQAFKSDARENPVMDALVYAWINQQIEDLVNYFSGLIPKRPIIYGDN